MCLRFNLRLGLPPLFFVASGVILLHVADRRAGLCSDDSAKRGLRSQCDRMMDFAGLVPERI